MKRSTPIRRKVMVRRLDRDPAKTVEVSMGLKAQRLRVAKRQGGDPMGWVPCNHCRHPFRLDRLDLSHIKALGMGRSRRDASDQLNADTNKELLCRNCHQAHELRQGLKHALERERLAEVLGRAYDEPTDE